ncbi:PQQ-binding-like beta-propeller repeat protein [Verrucomicrobiota bacterium sgz303538]
MLPRLLLAALLVSSTYGADWPQWRGPERTGHVPAGELVPSTLPSEPKIVWRVPIGEGFASPVVAGGKVFYLDNKDGQEVAHAADASTGRELWQATIFSSHKDGFGTGPRCTPVVDGDRVYVQSAKGEFQCLAVADGKVKWRTNFVTDFGAIYIGEKGKAAGASRHGAAGAPIIDGDNVIVQVGSSQGASLVAFNKATGEVVWKSQNDQTSYSPPILATIAGTRQLIAFTAEALIGLDPRNGNLLWRAPLKTALGRHVTTPIVWKNLVIVASHQIGLVAMRIAAAGGAFTATEAWVNKSAAMNFSSPVLVGDYLYGLGPSRNVMCIAAESGQPAWEQTGLVQTSPDRAEAAFMVMGKNVLLLSDSGELVMFATDPQSYREIGRSQVCGNTWCNPAYVNGRLYLRDARELLCVELESGAP